MCPQRRRSTPRRWLPGSLLAWSLLTTAAATAVAYLAIEGAAERRLEEAADAGQVRIEQRLEHFVTLLRGLAALFQTSEVDQSTFDAYLTRLRIEEFYPGVQGIGFAAYTSASTLGDLEREWRARDPSFHVWPETRFHDGAVILMLAPPDDRNRVAIGYDMMSEPTRREAMRRAVDEGRSRLTAPVTLVQEVTEERQAGFLLYVPVYEAIGVPDTAPERWRTLRGFAYGAFRAGDLAQVLRSGLPDDVVLEIEDTHGEASISLHRLEPVAEERTAERTVAIAGRTWTVGFRSAARAPLPWLPPLVALVGLVVTILLYTAARNLLFAEGQERWLRAEAERERERAERAAELRERLVAVVSHDLRNPLGAITSATQLLDRTDLPPRARALVTRMARAASRMARMIDQLLDVARLRSGQRLTLSRADVDIGELARGIVEEHRLAAPDRSIELRTEGELRASVDADRLGQVLSNLVGNALQHGRDSQVTVCVVGNGALSCSVHNEGAIPESVRSTLFAPFTQGGGHEPSRSLGLGLFISRELVRAHGGELEVESTEEQGTTFRFTIPNGSQGEAAV